MIIDNNMPQPVAPDTRQPTKMPKELEISTAEKIKNLEELLEFVEESPESFEHLGGADEIRRMIQDNLKKFREEA